MVTIIKKYTGGAYPYYEYACLSTDVKPVSLVPENSICHEIDTGKHYYLANGEWHQLPARGGEGLPADFPAEGSANANKFLGFDANGDYTAKDAPSGGGGAEKFVVTLTEDDSGAETVWTADKTAAAIYAAYQADKEVVCSVTSDGVDVEIPCKAALEFEESSETYDVAFFVGFGIGPEYFTIQVRGTSEADSWEVERNGLEELPSYSSSDNGKVLGVDNGALTWVDNYAPLIVTLTVDQSTGDLVGNKTYKEVCDAFNGGQAVTFKSEFSGLTVATNALSVGLANDGYSVAFVFGGAITEAEGAENAYVSVHIN